MALPMDLLLVHCWTMMELHTSLREMGLPHRGGPGPAVFYPIWREDYRPKVSR